jgi:hypothetical protein
VSNKTIIACRPGMKQAMESAFAGMKVIVDDTLDKDYEFREEAMTFDEIMEAEISKEERQEADPKNALTFLVPLSVADADDINTWEAPILAIRVERGPSPYDVTKAIQSVKPTTQGDFPDFEVNVSATIGALRAELKKAGYNVLSISEADGLIALDV